MFQSPGRSGEGAEGQAGVDAAEDQGLGTAHGATEWRTAEAGGTGQRAADGARPADIGRAHEPSGLGDDRMVGGFPAAWQQDTADGDARPILPGPCVLGDSGTGRPHHLYLSGQLCLLSGEASGAHRQPQGRDSKGQQPIQNGTGMDATDAPGTRS